MNKFIFAALLVLTFVLSGCGSGGNAGNSGGTTVTPAADAKPVSNDLKITMLNVGQGDAFLIQTKTQNILIDLAGPRTRRHLCR